MINNTDIEAFEYYNQSTEDKEQSISEMVNEFAVVMGQFPDPKLMSLLIREEYEELSEIASTLSGFETSKEELKELADLVYVIYGYARVLAYNLDEAIRRVHKNNLERCVWPDGKIYYREDGKVKKNPDAPKVDLSDLI